MAELEILGQPDVSRRLGAAVERPVPSYLFVGPPGSGRRAAAMAFAGELFATTRPDDPDRHRRLAVAEAHPDLVIVERVGATISADQAREVVRTSVLSPVDAGCKVIVLLDFHLVGDQAAIVLKAIEEPPATTHFVIVANDVPPELVTIASRCIRIDFSAVPTAVVVERLVEEGASAELAQAAAAAAGGDLGRARLLATDGSLLDRLDAWGAAPAALDGTGHAVMCLVEQLTGRLDEAAAPLVAAQAAELEELQAGAEATGVRLTGVKTIEQRHKREQRRQRADELRLGLSTMGRWYRDALVDGRLEAGVASTAIDAVNEASDALDRNPSERLWLAALFTRLPAAG